MGLGFLLALYGTPHVPKQKEELETQRERERESFLTISSLLGLLPDQHQLCPTPPPTPTLGTFPSHSCLKARGQELQLARRLLPAKPGLCVMNALPCPLSPLVPLLVPAVQAFAAWRTQPQAQGLSVAKSI